MRKIFLSGWLMSKAGIVLSYLFLILITRSEIQAAVHELPATSSPKTQNVELVVERQAKSITIRSTIPDGVSEIEICLYSDRNNVFSKYTDISPRDTDPKDYNFSWEAWYPVVDVLIDPTFEAIVLFDIVEQGSYTINGKYYREKYTMKEEVIIPAGRLEFWANELFVEPKTNVLKGFYLRKHISVDPGEFICTIPLLTEDWSGEIVINALNAGETSEMGTYTIERPDIDIENKLEQFKGDSLEHPRLIASLEALVGYTLRSRNQLVTSPAADGVYLFYDLESRTYRRVDWTWPWGVAVKMILESANIPEISAFYDPEDLHEVAYEMGKASLQYRKTDQDHPAYGLATSRFGESSSGLTKTYGYTEYINPADALFLAGWGWMPLFQATGDSVFLRSTYVMVESTEKLIRDFDLVPMDYVVEGEGEWKDFTLNEHGFGMEGLAELYAATHDSRVRDIGHAYIEQVLDKLGREDGLWERRYNRKTGEVLGRDHLDVVKGQGWAMEGLLAAYRLMPEERYIDLAKKMADHLVDSQHPEGYWPFRYTRTVEEEGIAEKGTALWSYLLYRLYDATKEERYLVSARKALHWCLENQYSGPDKLAYGGLVGDGRRSGINFRFWYPMVCSYTVSFFGLAVLEELHLQGAD